MDDQQRKALSEYNAAAAALKRQLKTKQGGKKDEKRFADAYQTLVSLGLAPQIRKKYRG